MKRGGLVSNNLGEETYSSGGDWIRGLWFESQVTYAFVAGAGRSARGEASKVFCLETMENTEESSVKTKSQKEAARLQTRDIFNLSEKSN